MMRKIKILHCIYDSPGNTWINGGGAYRTFHIYELFPSQWDITILTGNHKNQKYHNSRIKTLYMGSSSYYLASRLSYITKAKQYIRKNAFKFDLIIEDFVPYLPLHTEQYPHSVLMLQNFFGINNIKKFGIFGIIPFLQEKSIINKFPYKIFSSSFLGQQISVKDSSSVVTIPYGINEKLFYQKSIDNQYILYLGRIEFYQKGLDILLEVFSDKELQSIPLVIAGSGKDEKKMLKKIYGASNITYVGRIQGKQKYDYLRKSRFVVMPSRYESFGITAIEAAAVGKPTIGVQKTGLEETIKHNKTGILLNQLSKKELKSCILKLWYDKKKRILLGRHAAVFAKKFRWHRIADKQRKFYLSILKNNLGIEIK